MTRRHLLVLALMTACLLDGLAVRAEEAGKTAGGSADTLLEQARERMREGDFQSALELLTHVLSADPESVPANLNYVTSLRRLGRHEQARGHLLMMIERFPTSQEPLVQMGYLNRSLGRLDESARWFHRASELEGGWYNYIRLAVTYTDLGDRKRMRQATERLRDSPYGEALGSCLRHLYGGKFVRARDISEREVRRDEDELWRSLAADLAVLLADYPRAYEHYAELAPELVEDPATVGRANASQAIWLAFILKGLGRPEQGEALARQALRAFDPSEHEHVNVKVYRMGALVLLGHNEAALAELRAAIDAGYRSVMFERTVRMDSFKLLAPLHPLPAFRAMIAEIEADNTEMRHRLDRVEGLPSSQGDGPFSSGRSLGDPGVRPRYTGTCVIPIRLGLVTCVHLRHPGSRDRTSRLAGV